MKDYSLSTTESLVARTTISCSVEKNFEIRALGDRNNREKNVPKLYQSKTLLLA